MKRKLIILCSLILIVITPMRLSAADLILDAAEYAVAGETVGVTISLSEAIMVKSGYIEVSYDETKLEHVSNVFRLSENPQLSGTIDSDSVFAYSEVTSISGELISIYFTAKNTFDYDECDIQIEVVLNDADGVSVTLAATIAMNMLPDTTAAETTTETTTASKGTTAIHETTSDVQTTAETTTAHETTARETTSETAVWSETTTEGFIATESTTAIATTGTTPDATTVMNEQTEWQTSDVGAEETMVLEIDMTTPGISEETTTQTTGPDKGIILVVGITVICNLVIITIAGAAIYLFKKKNI